MPAQERDFAQELKQLSQGFLAVRNELARVIVGQDEAVARVLIALLSGGHCLLLGVPGLAKTLLVHSLSQALDLEFNRVQFTPDLMPSDITGTEIIDEEPGGGKRQLRFVRGPVFANMLLADEINRTPPKTQAALLEAMQEHHVTSGGVKYALPEPFFVLATQNPIEQEGTYPLPEAQLDRFMFLVKLDYPSRDEEIRIIKQTTANREAVIQKVIDGPTMLYFQKLVRSLPVSDHVAAYCADLARLSRPGDPLAPDFVRRNLSYGAGPRAGQYLLLAAKARAALNGRINVCCDDVRCCAREVLRHRLACNFHAAGENLTSDAIIDMLLKHVPEPKG